MSCSDNPTLFGAEPIVEALVTLAWDEGGWRLTVNHRHHAGRFGACGRDTYEDLSLDELADVFAATTAGYGPWSAPNGSREP
jgi:hypothetical protein